MSISTDKSSVDELIEAMKASHLIHDPLRPLVILQPNTLKPKPPQDDNWCAVGKLHSTTYINYQEAQSYARKYWNLKKEIIVTPYQKNKNYFHFRFNHVADILAVNYPKPWLIHDSILAIVQTPLEGVHKIKEEEFEKVILSITMKIVPNDYITFSALACIASPASELMLFKDPYGRDYYEKMLKQWLKLMSQRCSPLARTA